MKAKRKKPSYGVSVALAALFALITVYKLIVVNNVKHEYDGDDNYGN